GYELADLVRLRRSGSLPRKEPVGGDHGRPLRTKLPARSYQSQPRILPARRAGRQLRRFIRKPFGLFGRCRWFATLLVRRDPIQGAPLLLGADAAVPLAPRR